MFFNGIPEMPITNIDIKNVFVTSKLGAEISYSKDVKMENVEILSEDNKPLKVSNTQSCNFDGFKGVIEFGENVN